MCRKTINVLADFLRFPLEIRPYLACRACGETPYWRSFWGCRECGRWCRAVSRRRPFRAAPDSSARWTRRRAAYTWDLDCPGVGLFNNNKNLEEEQNQQILNTMYKQNFMQILHRSTGGEQYVSSVIGSKNGQTRCVIASLGDDTDNIYRAAWFSTTRRPLIADPLLTHLSEWCTARFHWHRGRRPGSGHPLALLPGPSHQSVRPAPYLQGKHLQKWVKKTTTI